MNDLKISIITISYNCEAEIEETILSVVSQTYENKEYIIIDGGSMDKTMQIVDKYRDKIDVVVSEPDKGRSDAFNKGIAKATGDYIVMINAGDMLVDDALNKFVKAYKPGYDVIKGNTIRWNYETGHRSIETPVIKYSAIPFKFYVCHQSTYISKEAYKHYGVYEVDLRIVMDFELMLRFTKVGATFYTIDENLAIFRMGGISQVSSNKRLEEMKYALKKNGRSSIAIFVFICYIRLRTLIRILLDKINPDLKSYLVTKRNNIF